MTTPTLGQTANGHPPVGITELLGRVRELGRPLECADLDKLDGWPGCCHSCHDDADEGYSPLPAVTYMGVPTHVCCAVLNWLNANRPNEGSERRAPARSLEYYEDTCPQCQPVGEPPLASAHGSADERDRRLMMAEEILSDLATGYWTAILDDNAHDPVSELMGQRILNYWRTWESPPNAELSDGAKPRSLQ